jgi:hypothetical protein
MTQSLAATSQHSQFENFLFASIGDEENGMTLTVLSALARLDRDPWREAANIASMPKEAAIDWMTSLISALPKKPCALSDIEAIAARLIALLPPRQKLVRQTPANVLAAPPAATYPRVVIFLTLIALMLSAQFFMTSRQSSASTAAPPAPSSNANLTSSVR